MQKLLPPLMLWLSHQTWCCHSFPRIKDHSSVQGLPKFSCSAVRTDKRWTWIYTKSCPIILTYYSRESMKRYNNTFALLTPHLKDQEARGLLALFYFLLWPCLLWVIRLLQYSKLQQWWECQLVWEQLTESPLLCSGSDAKRKSQWNKSHRAQSSTKLSTGTS